AFALAFNAATGELYVGGDADSSDFPGTSGGAQSTHANDNADNDVFVARLSGDLAAQAPPLVCIGDCDGSGRVAPDETVALVNIALGNAAASTCPDGIPNGAAVDINLILQAVSNATLITSGECPASAPFVATGANPHSAAANTASATPALTESRAMDTKARQPNRPMPVPAPFL
ncbi:MAG TPA: hypothetical protein VL403_11545, partial [Candidatus Kryptonia bacterium]|nr:hypothetical protein [Candidatus Kryptonia bacterium]